jgi:hypothetical protein
MRLGALCGRPRQNASGGSRKTVLRNYMSNGCRTVVGTRVFRYRRAYWAYRPRVRQGGYGHVAEWLRSGLQSQAICL